MPKLLIVAQSARMLAHSARRGGWIPLGLDRFADTDTRALCGYWEALPWGHAGFDGDCLLAAVRRADPRGEAEGLVYGGGLENYPDLLAQLARRAALLGNDPRVLRRLRRPEAFFALLDELGIAYPETRFSMPVSALGWLAKDRRGEGGKGVLPCGAQGLAADSFYFQRHLEGASVTFLFLADGRRIRPIGFNRQWTAENESERPFLFAGIIGAAELAPWQRRQILEDASRLTERTGLVGLSSLDYICDGEKCQLLEINPRPGASLALYDDDWPAGLLVAHVRACRGELPAGEFPARKVRGFEVVYAGAPVTIPERMEWPVWAVDRPPAGTAISPGQPVCSVTASAETAGGAESLLASRKGALRRMLAATVDRDHIAAGT